MGTIFNDITANVILNQATLSSAPVGGTETVRLDDMSTAIGAVIDVLSVANIDDPSTELNAVAGSAAGSIMLAYEVGAAADDEYTMYAWDASGAAEEVPYSVDGSSGLWVALSGKYLNSNFSINGTVIAGEVLINTVSTDSDAELVVRTNNTFDGMAIKAPDGPRIFFDEGADGSEVETAFIGLQAADNAFVMRQWINSGTDILFSIQSGGARGSAADREVLQLLHDGDGSIFGNFTIGSDLTVSGELTGNLTVNDDLTINGDLIADDDIRWQDSYILTEAQAGGFPAIRNTVSGEPMNLRVQSADMDGTDTIGFNLDAVGQPGVANRETMVFSYNNARNDYEFFTFRAGTGLNRDIKIGHNSNPNELVILTTGEILVRNKIAITQIDLNEYIDSINDGYMDYGATTAHRFNANVNVTGMVRQTTTWHAYGGFEDQAETIVCGVGDWNHITNVGNDLWNLDEADGISESGDVFTLVNTGDYIGTLSVSISGLNGKDFHVRVYNNTQIRVEGRAIGISTTGANNEMNVVIPIYVEGTASDEIQFEIMSADGSDPVVDDALFWLAYLHD